MKFKTLYRQFFGIGESNERSVRAKKNVLASVIIKGISIFISLLLVPLTIHYVEVREYGIWLTLSSIIAWFSFFDVGLGNGLRNKYAEAKASGNLGAVRTYISTTYAILAIIFAIVWLLFFIFYTWVDWSLILNAPREMSEELSSLAFILISFFCLQVVLKILNTILIADQSPSISAFLDLSGQFLILLVTWVLIKSTEGSLIKLGLTVGVIPVIILIISSFYFYKKRFRNVAPSLGYVDFKSAKDLMNLGVKFFAIQIAVLVIYQTSNVIIAQISGPEDVTVYNVAFKYFGVALMLFSIILTPFWSSFTDAFFLKDYDWMKKTVSILRKIALAICCILVMMVVASDLVYKIWTSGLVKVRLSISIVLALYMITNIWNSLHSHVLNGMGKIRLQLYFSLIGTFLNVPLAIFLGKRYGIEGVVASAILLNIFSAVYSPIQVNKLIHQKAHGVWNK